MKNRNPLIWLSAADPEILARCRTDRPKYVGLGAAVLITACIGGLSCAFALAMALRVNPVVAAVMGAFWALAIMSIDRWMISSVKRQERWYQNLGAAAPRIVLAVLIGIIISTPLVLRIFEPEINSEIVKMHSEDDSAYNRSLRTDPDGKQLQALRKEQTTLNGQIKTLQSGNVDVNSDAEVKRTKADRDSKQKTYNQNNAAYDRCYLDDECGAVSKSQALPLLQAQRDSARKALVQAKDDYNAALDTARTSLQGAQSKDLGAKQDRLTEVEKGIADLEKQQADSRTEHQARTKDNTGLLIRIEALNRVTDDRPTLLWAHLLLFLFLTTFECLPVLVKFLLSLGKPTVYEQAVEANENDQIAIEKQLSRERRATQLMLNRDPYVSATLWRDKRDEVIPGLVDETIAADRDVYLTALRESQERRRARAISDPDAYLRSVGERFGGGLAPQGGAPVQGPTADIPPPRYPNAPYPQATPAAPPSPPAAFPSTPGQAPPYPGPDAPYPDAPYPAAENPAAQYPTAQYPTAENPAAENPAAQYPPAASPTNGAANGNNGDDPLINGAGAWPRFEPGSRGRRS
ncbi:DUF4407 domain-containing protein [Cryptosporangium sp. NPDC051539]|uniref:DUF4407 domain-containing protein n=1 Tax=Cryptosporangium sp. NPDC051539 TaxID=3363962 RepID=UPI00379549A0